MSFRRKTQNYSGISTVIKQTLAGIICLSVGFGFIWLITTWANSWGVFWPDGSKFDFWPDAILIGIAFVFLIIAVTAIQFMEGLSPYQVFRLSIRATFIALLFIIVLSLLMIFLIGSTLQLTLLTIAFLLISTIPLGPVIGVIQAGRLLIEVFDPIEHHWLRSNKASLEAVQSGILPYRQQLGTIWCMIFFALISISFTVTLIIIWDYVDNTTLGIGILIVFIVVGVSVAMIRHCLKLFLNPRFTFVEGWVSKTKIRTMGETEVELLKLTCSGQVLSTDSIIWHGIIEGQSYRLWYSAINRAVVAFEALSQSGNHTRQGIRKWNYDEVLERLERRALGFHHVLSRTGVYRTELSEAEFLRRINDIVREMAEEVTEDIANGSEEFLVTVMILPEILLNELSDIIYTSSWDMELGAVEFFNQLQSLFDQSPFHFTWSLDKAQGKLDFEIDSIAWSIDVRDMTLIDKSFSFAASTFVVEARDWLNILSSELDELYDYLTDQGWQLYPSTTGDEIIVFLLLPEIAVDAVKDYLISIYDPRAEWFYTTGIPHSEKPLDIWPW